MNFVAVMPGQRLLLENAERMIEGAQLVVVKTTSSHPESFSSLLTNGYRSNPCVPLRGCTTCFRVQTILPGRCEDCVKSRVRSRPIVRNARRESNSCPLKSEVSWTSLRMGVLDQVPAHPGDAPQQARKTRLPPWKSGETHH